VELSTVWLDSVFSVVCLTVELPNVWLDSVFPIVEIDCCVELPNVGLDSVFPIVKICEVAVWSSDVCVSPIVLLPTV
jgi:hypothetical protein